MLTELPSAGLLEGFTIFPRGKKSYLSLTYDLSQKHEPTHFALAATVIDSFLVKLAHPSDVIPNVPPSVRKALNHLFKSDSKISDFNDGDYDNGEGPVAKPDIDKLYETIKVYHDSKGHTTGGIDLVFDPQVKWLQMCRKCFYTLHHNLLFFGILWFGLTTFTDELYLHLQHRNLLPTLRPYQRNAVRWMLSREMDTNDDNVSNAEDRLHPLYEGVETLEGTKLYYNRVAGFLVREKPFAVKSLPGGILADEVILTTFYVQPFCTKVLFEAFLYLHFVFEFCFWQKNIGKELINKCWRNWLQMGLGKTVEVLSLLLCNPRPNVPKPEWKKPVHIKKETRKKRKRIRSLSPVEFRIEEIGSKNESEDLLIQLDGNQVRNSVELLDLVMAFS